MPSKFHVPAPKAYSSGLTRPMLKKQNLQALFWMKIPLQQNKSNVNDNRQQLKLENVIPSDKEALLLGEKTDK